jgi:hypothetical protein
LLERVGVSQVPTFDVRVGAGDDGPFGERGLEFALDLFAHMGKPLAVGVNGDAEKVGDLEGLRQLEHAALIEGKFIEGAAMASPGRANVQDQRLTLLMRDAVEQGLEEFLMGPVLGKKVKD